MAQFILAKYEIIAKVNGVSAGIDVGNIIRVYYDDSDGLLKVYIYDDADDDSGTVITSGTIGKLGVDYISLYYNEHFQTCEGTTLVRFISFRGSAISTYPFIRKGVTYNSDKCNAIVCDLIFQGAATVVNESTAGAGDGSFTVSATSSHGSVEYGLTPFQFGEGQASGAFENKSAGGYTVYARDQYNCEAEIMVSVEADQDISSNYGVLYRAEWDDLQGASSRFDVLERDYSGSEEEVTQDSIPLKVNKPSQDFQDLFIPIHPSNATLNLMSKTDFKFRNLFTQDDRKYLGIWYKKTGEEFEEKWRGYMIPSVYSEPYIPTPYTASLTFVDGLETLKDEPFLSNSGEKLNGELKLIKIIAFILSKLNLELPIRSGINVYDSGMDTDDSDDPLDQAYIDVSTFYRDEEPWDCHKVLEEILKPFGARVWQWEGKWWITRIQEEFNSYDYRDFDASGDYDSNGTFNPRASIKNTTSTDRAVYFNGSGTLEVVPAYSSIKVVNKLNDKGNLLLNGDFNDVYDETISGLFSDFTYKRFPGWNLILNSSPKASGILESIDYKGDKIAGIIFNQNGNEGMLYLKSKVYDFQFTPFDKIRFSIKIGVDKIDKVIPFGVVRFMIKIGSYYLTNGVYIQDGVQKNSWSTSETVYRSKVNFSNELTTLDYEFDVPNLSSINDSSLEVRLYNYSALITDFGDFRTTTGGQAALEAQDVTTIKDGDVFSVLQIVTIDLGSDKVRYYNIRYVSYVNDGSTPAGDWFEPDTGEGYYRVDKTVVVDITQADENDPPPTPEPELISNNKFYIASVDLDILPNGFDPPTEGTTTFTNSINLKEKLEVEVELADLPSTFIPNAKNIYDDYFRLSDGTPTGTWTRDGVTESQPIQEILAKQYSNQYATQAQRITANITTKEQSGSSGIDLGFNNVLVETMDDDKIYFINGIEINDKTNEYQVELIELKDSSGSSDGGGSSPFSGAFSSAYGGDFDTEYN